MIRAEQKEMERRKGAKQKGKITVDVDFDEERRRGRKWRNLSDDENEQDTLIALEPLLRVYLG